MFVAIFTAITIGCLAGNTRESKSIDGADRLKSIEATDKWTINLIQSTKPSIKVEYPNTFGDKIIAEVRPDGTLYLGFKKNIVLIFDECHRSQFGELHLAITKTFKNYFIDQYMRSAYPDFKLRFFKKEGADWPKEIHSTVKVQGEVIKIPRHRTDLASEHLANDSVTTILSKNERCMFA